MSVGIDIGSKTIKIVELAHEGNNFSLKAAGAVSYAGADIATIADDNDLSGISSVLKKLAHDARVSSKNVNISLPETHVYTRVLKFPLLNDQEIASAVKWEAEEYIPIPINEAVLQHVILERQEQTNPPQVLVLLIAANKALVEKYIKAVESASFNVVGVETELISMVRSVAPLDKTVVLVDFGASSTDIAIARRGELFITRSIQTAGEAFSRAVAQSLGVAIEQAEEYKRTYGLLPDQLEGKVGGALTPVFRVVSEEIKKAIHYYSMEIRGEEPSTVILSGGTAGLPGITSYLAKLVGLEVQVANPFSKVKLSSESQKSLSNFAPLYSVACGLAMRG